MEQLRRLEHIIDTHMGDGTDATATFPEFAMAVYRIVDQKLYKCRTGRLDAYFRTQYQLSRAQVYRIIECGEIYEDLLEPLDANFVLVPSPGTQRVCKMIRHLATNRYQRQFLWSETLRCARHYRQRVTSTLVRSVWQRMVQEHSDLLASSTAAAAVAPQPAVTVPRTPTTSGPASASSSVVALPLLLTPRDHQDHEQLESYVWSPLSGMSSGSSSVQFPSAPAVASAAEAPVNTSSPTLSSISASPTSWPSSPRSDLLGDVTPPSDLRLNALRFDPSLDPPTLPTLEPPAFALMSGYANPYHPGPMAPLSPPPHPHRLAPYLPLPPAAYPASSSLPAPALAEQAGAPPLPPNTRRHQTDPRFHPYSF
ncbi:hypothetical protein RI367_007505 [Sorochytrium milnesiophthora]